MILYSKGLFLKKITFVFLLLVGCTVVASAQLFEGGDPVNGETLFNANCASCHRITKEVLAAPGLEGVDKKWKGKEDLLVKWIQDPKAAAATGDAYVKSLVDTYVGSFGWMAPQAVSKEEIQHIMAYIMAGPPQAAGAAADATSPCPTVDDAMANTVESNGSIWFLIMAILFLIVALSAVNVSRSLKSAVLVSNDKEALKDASMLELLKAWVSRNKTFVSIIGLFVTGAVLTLLYQAGMGVGIYEGYNPSQPIWFSHAVHNCENEIDCQYCHSSASKSKHAGIPSANVCMNCHKGIKKGTKTGEAEIAKIYAAVGFDPATGAYAEDFEEQPIEWVKVHNLPDHVFFSHQQHVTVGKLECQNCHGPVNTFTTGRISPVEWNNAVEMPGIVKLSKPTLTMGWCIECHNKSEIDLAGSGYYEEMHERMVNSDRGRELLRKITEDEKVTVEEMGGWECAKCHY